MTSSVGYVPKEGERWAFDERVTECFEDMLRRSIPQYDVMRESVGDLVGAAIERHGMGARVLDVGCSRGDAIAALSDRFPGTFFTGIEVSAPMLEAATARFESQRNVAIRESDLRHGFLPGSWEVILSVLTLQFTPLEHRQRILADVFDHTAPGGMFILVEKVLGADARIDAMLVERYLALKEANGYSKDEIERKKLALEGSLVPVTAAWNEDLLRRAGFDHVDCFWRWMNFAGWVAVRRRL